MTLEDMNYELAGIAVRLQLLEIERRAQTDDVPPFVHELNKKVNVLAEAVHTLLGHVEELALCVGEMEGKK